MAELIKNANGPADKITSPEKPAKEAPQLTIKDVAALGFDNELIRFAILQTDGCIWNAVDVLLRFEEIPNKGDGVERLEFALWIANNDRLQALKILGRISLQSSFGFFSSS